MSSSSSSSEQPAAATTESAKKLWRVARAVYLVLVKGLGKHQPKLAALGVHLHQMMSSARRGHRGGSQNRHDHGLDDLRDHPAFLTYLSSTISCRSMDPAAAVHPYPRVQRRGAASRGISCRAMDPSAAVSSSQYHYRPREVEFSCRSTPLHKRRRAQRRLDSSSYGSAANVSRLFELMDVKEEAATDHIDEDDEEEADVVALVVPAPATATRQVRITDSPFPAWEEEDQGGGVVDRRADEFIMWFHEQLRMQQQHRANAKAKERSTSTYYLVR
uniref:Uncharacterized protein n=1 Tax=Leersia perrieri TaxID=77586 RepID=A0A0D9WIS9_9ORYZ